MGGRQHSRGPTGSWAGLALLLVAALAAIAFAAPARADENLQTSSTPPLRIDRSAALVVAEVDAAAVPDVIVPPSAAAAPIAAVPESVPEENPANGFSSVDDAVTPVDVTTQSGAISLPAVVQPHVVVCPLIRGSHAERRGSITASDRSISRRPSAARQSTTRRAPKPNRQSHLPRPTALRRRTVRAPAAVPITERIALICPQILRQSVPKVMLITAIGIASGSRTAAQRSRRS